jgi:hypothetical protein
MPTAIESLDSIIQQAAKLKAIAVANSDLAKELAEELHEIDDALNTVLFDVTDTPEPTCPNCSRPVGLCNCGHSQ